MYEFALLQILYETLLPFCETSKVIKHFKIPFEGKALL